MADLFAKQLLSLLVACPPPPPSYLPAPRPSIEFMGMANWAALPRPACLVTRRAGVPGLRLFVVVYARIARCRCGVTDRVDEPLSLYGATEG